MHAHIHIHVCRYSTVARAFLNIDKNASGFISRDEFEFELMRCAGVKGERGQG